MFRLIKQVFVVLLRFIGCLATKFMPLNNEPSMIRPTFIDLNLVELNFHPFTTMLNKYNQICNAINELSTEVIR